MAKRKELKRLESHRIYVRRTMIRRDLGIVFRTKRGWEWETETPVWSTSLKPAKTFDEARTALIDHVRGALRRVLEMVESGDPHVETIQFAEAES